MLLAAVLILNPIGLDVVHAAFFSSEALSRGIWRPIMFAVAAAMILIVLLEWRTRTMILNRRARGKTIA